LIAHDAATRSELLAGGLTFLFEEKLSSLHILFPRAEDSAACAAAGMLLRDSVQFHWTNPGYRDFADFLSTMNHAKRKRISQERRKLASAGVRFHRLVGREIDAGDWAYFFRCYTTTYRRHHSTPYLSLAFFERIGATLPDNVVLVLGERAGKPICAAFDVFSPDTLWGRYWGATEFVSGLHFEACYYQAIDFCIERRIGQFEGGAQGVHKLARGLLPVTTRSAHAISDPDFARAIARFAADERAEVAHAVEELEAASPFKAAFAAEEHASRGRGDADERAGV